MRREGDKATIAWETAFKPFAGATSDVAKELEEFFAAGFDNLRRLLGTGPGRQHLARARKLCGFVMATVAGFFLTAIPNWTGRPTRVAGSASIGGEAAALIDLAFPPANSSGMFSSPRPRAHP